MQHKRKEDTKAVFEKHKINDIHFDFCVLLFLEQLIHLNVIVLMPNNGNLRLT